MPTTAAETHVKLPADSNQALGIARLVIDFLLGKPATRGEYADLI
jgi:hypothetical protein